MLVEHREPLDRERVLRLFQRCGPARYERKGAAVTPEDRERWAASAETSGWSQAYAWDVPGPSGSPARVNIALQATALPMRGAPPASWLHLVCDVAFAAPEEGAWLADYLSAMGEAFTIPFAFADSAHHLRSNAASDPRKLVWPLMLLGPEHVQRVGAERLLSAPGLVRPLAGGAFFVQVSEAPLAARARALEALAQHIGRPARR